MRFFTFLFLVLISAACSEDGEPIHGGVPELYFPPISSNQWERSNPLDYGWDMSAIDELNQNLSINGTRAFILLKDGKIVIEEYFGKQIIGSQDFDQNSNWYWASAGKTLTATLTIIAKQQGLLELGDPSSKYLGQGWTSLPLSDEEKVRVVHHLTMTTGLDDGVADSDNFDPENLKFLAEPGERWAYHNAPYTLMEQIVAQASGKPFGEYFNDVIGNKIGMNGFWQTIGFNNVYLSNARSMARFGLLILAEGSWNGNEVIKNDNNFSNMIQSSQSINQSYGYLWWLNGQSNFMIPGPQIQFPGSWAPDAPSDMVCGMGLNGQYVCVIPSMDMVLVRMGDNPDQSLVPIAYLNDIWQFLNKIIPER